MITKNIVNFMLDSFPAQPEYLVKNLEIEGESSPCPLYRATFRSAKDSKEYLEWHFLQLGSDRISVLRYFGEKPTPYLLIETDDILWFGQSKEALISCNLAQHAQLLYQFTLQIDYGYTWYPQEGEVSNDILELLNKAMDFG